MASIDFNLEKLQSEASDLQKMAPGTWGCLHMMALAADEEGDDSFLHLLHFIKMLAKRFKAEQCRQHFSNFVRSELIYPGKAFEWTVKAHNNVNRRTGKSELTTQQAMEIWKPSNVKITPCQSDMEAPSLPQTPPAATLMGPLATMNAIRGINWVQR